MRLRAWTLDVSMHLDFNLFFKVIVMASLESQWEGLFKFKSGVAYLEWLILTGNPRLSDEGFLNVLWGSCDRALSTAAGFYTKELPSRTGEGNLGISNPLKFAIKLRIAYSIFECFGIIASLDKATKSSGKVTIQGYYNPCIGYSLLLLRTQTNGGSTKPILIN